MSLMPSMPLIDGIGLVDGIVLIDGELGVVELFDVPGVEELEPQAANARASAAAALLALLGCALAVLTVLSVPPTCVHSGGSARAGGMATMTVVQDMTSHVPSHPCGDDKPACCTPSPGPDEGRRPRPGPG
jgi:hypothetical protein